VLREYITVQTNTLFNNLKVSINYHILPNSIKKYLSKQIVVVVVVVVNKYTATKTSNI